MMFLILLLLLLATISQSLIRCSVPLKKSSILMLSSCPLPPRPEFLREINENKVLREKLSDDEDSILLYNDLSQFGYDMALAEEHIAIGNYEDAQRLARDAMLLAGHSHQSNNIYSAYATGILGDALYAEGKFKESSEAYKESFEAYKRHYRSDTGPETVELMAALQLISFVLLNKKDFEEAQVACANALGITERLLGPCNVNVASSMCNLATAYVNKGDLGSEPEILLNKALAIYDQKSLELKDNPQNADEMENLNYLVGSVQVSLGSLHFLRGDDDTALKHYNVVNKMFDEGIYNHDEAVQALKNAALIFWKNRNMPKKAEELLAKSLFKLETSDKFGINSSRTKKIRQLLNDLREGKPAPVTLASA